MAATLGIHIGVVVLLTLASCEIIYHAGDHEILDDSNWMGDGGWEAGTGDTYMSDWNADWALLSGRLRQPKCVDIPANMSLCRNIGYHQMRLPNLLEHDSLAEVTQQAKSWVPLLGIQCHPDTKLFLCSLFSPVCLDRPIWPCRSLCQSVRSSCEGFMNKYGFPWPDMLLCDKFPLENDLCIHIQTEHKPDDKVCEPCNKPNTFEGIVDNFCSSDFAIKVKARESVISQGLIKISTDKKKRIYKKGSLRKRDKADLTLYMQDGENCECPLLDQGANNRNLLVMGHKVNGKFMVNYAQAYDKDAMEQRRALRAVRKEDICKGGQALLTAEEQEQDAHRATPSASAPLHPQQPQTATPGPSQREQQRNKERKRKQRRRNRERASRPDKQRNSNKRRNTDN